MVPARAPHNLPLYLERTYGEESPAVQAHLRNSVARGADTPLRSNPRFQALLEKYE